MTIRACVVVPALVFFLQPVFAAAQTFVAPPRSVADITAILDQEKPDVVKLAKLKSDAEAAPPQGASKRELGAFFYKRAQAHANLGRVKDAIADAEQAVTNSQGEDYQTIVSRYEQFLILRLRDAGEQKRKMALVDKQLAAFSQKGKGRRFSLQSNLAQDYVRAGDINRAESFVERNRALLAEAKKWDSYDLYAASYIASVEEGAGRVAEARGRYQDAEKSFHKASLSHAEAMRRSVDWDSVPPKESFERGIDYALAFEGRVKVKQGRVAEGESDVRRALLSRLTKNGKFHADTAGILSILVYVVQEQGRYGEADELQRQVISIFESLGYPADGTHLVNAQLFLAQILNLERRFEDASKLYDRIDQLTANWPPAQRDTVSGGLSRLNVLLSRGDTSNVVEIAQRAFDRERKRSGERSFNTAMTRGYLAIALSRTGRAIEASGLFKEAIPVLIAPSGGADDDSGTTAAAREGRIRTVVEGYLRFLSRNPEIAGANVAEETFGYADVLRGQSVQRALQASSARSATKNPELGNLIRNEQDSSKQLGALVASLNNLLSQSSADRDAKTLKDTQSQIDKLHASLAQIKKDIAKKFPEYGSLINPSPPAASDLRKLLAADEAVISYYFGRFDSFAWLVRKNEPMRFVRLRLTLGDLNSTVSTLRNALEPKAELVSDIPAFDIQLAFELYQKILQPFEDDLRPLKNLVVATNGALGLLPLSLLPTESDKLRPEADESLFASYRQIKWLARTHAVSVVPSISSLSTLRKIPAGKANRSPFVAFGDPLFSIEQANEPLSVKLAETKIADVVNVTRGAPLKRRNSPQLDDAKNAQLAQLPRLPDTAEELKSIALALQAVPSKVLNLGKDANEKAVKSMDLSGVRILAFATHGLVPGELDGLTQPALALSAPGLSGSEGDGLLTMEEILGLKLDADWVVLSACNTGAGAGAGAEAASGLGRAFFYAGTRALLVTNWSVHSQSARELVTDLFKRQADNPNLTRAEALRLTMMALVDGQGYIDTDGKAEFAYAHPLFWAPYSIIGDGGVR